MGTTNNIWYVEHPTYRYAEDVKALARELRLVIVDPAVAPADRPGAAADVPALTIRADYLPPEPTANEAPADAAPAVEAAPAKASAKGKAAKAAAADGKE